jgi:hypothetical protein
MTERKINTSFNPKTIRRGPKAKAEVGEYRLPEGCCRYCDDHRLDSMMPPHSPSARCESGKRPHCTCDTCF